MAIAGKVKEELSMESVLSKVSALDIYAFFNPNKDWELNQACLSPFKIETHPSFIIGNKYGQIGHFAFNDPDKRGDCFSFVKQLRGLHTLNDVLEVIDNEMGLGIKGVKKDYKTTISESKKVEVTKRNTLIQVVARKFTKSELEYWNQYYQSEDDLKREEIYSIKKMFLNKRLHSLEELRFGYFYNGFWKIYQPLADKRKKWLTNAPLTLLDGKENIKDCDIAWVTKSKKDKMVLRKLYNCVVATQNESLACFSQENVDFITNNSKKQVILYDSDDSGVKACQAITSTFNFGYCNPPRQYLPNIKDFSDLAKIHGLNTLEQIFRQKGII